MKQLEENYLNLKNEIKDSKVKLIVVSKTRPIEEIKELYLLGQRHFGENRVQELSEKAQALKSLCPEIEWHMIGHLQSNKINNLLKVPNLKMIHSIDSMDLLDELIKKKPENKISIFLEVKTSHEDEKSGFEEKNEIERAIQKIKENGNYQFQGLMTMAPIRSEDILQDAKKSFQQLKQLKNELKDTSCELSMGMSGDYQIAISEGADWIRVGSKIFVVT